MRRGGATRTRRGAAALACILLVAAARVAPESSPSDALPTCPLCAEDPGVPIVPLEAAELDSILGALSARNTAAFAAIDSLWQAGHFGAPERDESRRRAQLVARAATTNCYTPLFQDACDSLRVHEATAASFAPVVEKYTDPSLLNVARLRRARFGLGRVCVTYDVAETGAGETTLGGKHMRWRIKDTDLGGARRRVLSLDLPSGEDVVEVLLAEHYGFAVERIEDAGSDGPAAAFVVHDLEGGWLRKWGTHRPTAFMFWATPGAIGAPAPDAVRVGVRIYVPNLRFRLPSFLPDINLDDLREVELPMPILTLASLDAYNAMPWLEVAPGFGFRHWVGQGPVPAALRTRFPDH